MKKEIKRGRLSRSELKRLWENVTPVDKDLS